MDNDLKESYIISNNYQDVEFPLYYRRFMIDALPFQETFVAEHLQKIYDSGRLKGTRLLDFGCGPSVHKIAPATRQFHDIVLSEWAEANRKEVEKWLRGDDDALDWTVPLERCARIEGFRDLQQGVATIEKRIRKAVKKVVPCDALSEDILPNGLGEFDVISISRCLENCCFTMKQYKEALRKITKYLKKGGALVMVTVLRAEFYYAHKRLQGFYLTEEMIREAVIDAGLELRDWFTWKNTEINENAKYGGIAVYYAVKV